MLALFEDDGAGEQVVVNAGGLAVVAEAGEVDGRLVGEGRRDVGVAEAGFERGIGGRCNLREEQDGQATREEKPSEQRGTSFIIKGDEIAPVVPDSPPNEFGASPQGRGVSLQACHSAANNAARPDMAAACNCRFVANRPERCQAPSVP